MKAKTRVYECKTCSRCFPTFQALGGHRTSHRIPRIRRREEKTPIEPRIHACSICGAVFPMGQALGGHMRRHKTNDHTAESKNKELMLDLNLPPAAETEGGLEVWGMDLGLGLSHELGPVIDF